MVELALHHGQLAFGPAKAPTLHLVKAPHHCLIVIRTQHQHPPFAFSRHHYLNHRVMSETTQSPEDAAAQRALEQARLRKERREAKLKAGGSARLNKITGLGGRIPGGIN